MVFTSAQVKDTQSQCNNEMHLCVYTNTTKKEECRITAPCTFYGSIILIVSRSGSSLICLNASMKASAKFSVVLIHID